MRALRRRASNVRMEVAEVKITREVYNSPRARAGGGGWGKGEIFRTVSIML